MTLHDHTTLRTQSDFAEEMFRGCTRQFSICKQHITIVKISFFNLELIEWTNHTIRLKDFGLGQYNISHIAD